MNAGPLESNNPNVELVGTQISDVKTAAPENAPALLNELNSVGDALRALIVRTKRLPRDKSLEPHQDPARSLALAQAHLQTGFMWLRRAITSPKEF